MSRISCHRHVCATCSPKGIKGPTSVNKLKARKRPTLNPGINSILNTKDLNLKLEIISRIYKCRTHPDRQELLKDWPNIEITQRTSLPLMEIRSGVFFIGDTTDNLIHGYGLAIYSPQRFYEGYFHNNLKHGPGFQKLEFGVYVGNYINNKPEGKGLFIWNNNDLYEGDFALGIKHGYGKYVTSTLTYVGEWKQNIPFGKGTIITKESKYEGNVISGSKHGIGSEEFKNGDVYTGPFINGKFEGVGTYCWFQSGAIYKGMFKNGLKHGEGSWSNPIGDKYEGAYESNTKCGEGTFKYSNGNIYKGSFLNDLRHGVGEMIWSDGERYYGNWKYGEPDNKAKVYSRTNPINKIKLRRCNTELNEKHSDSQVKFKLKKSVDRNQLSRLKTDMDGFTSQRMLREHSSKFLSNLETRTCPNKKSVRIVFNQEQSKGCCRSQRRKVHDPNSNCSARKICSVLTSSVEKVSRSNSAVRIPKFEVGYSKYSFNPQF